MAERIRAKDWSQTVLGPRSDWPQSLETALSIALSSRVPTIVCWGPALVVFYNDAAIPILGEKHPHALGEAGIAGRGEAWDVMAAKLAAVLQSGEAAWHDDQRLAVERDGLAEEAHFSWCCGPIAGETGAACGVFLSLRETTEQVLGERRLKLALAAAKGAAESQSRRCEELSEQLRQTVHFNEMFASVLGHDLRNPLGAMLTAAQLLHRRADSDRLIKPLTRIVTSGDRMARMIDQLLDFTRARVGGGLPVYPHQMDLAALLRQMLAELEDANPDRRIVSRLTGNLVGTWDADRLAQVIANLTQNAIQHGAESAPLVVSADGTAADFVTLNVSNQGVIPEELLPVLFEPFRGERPSLRKSQGLGLGLYITQQIIFQHGGTIEVSSSEMAGTTFTIMLPRRRERR
jgi:signal transduction histidine kinase